MVVTISASYGAGGAYVGPRLAERLGVPFVDRAIPNEVAQRLAVPLTEAIHHDESAGSVFERFIRVLAPAGLAFGARPFLEREIVDENAYRDATEQVIRERRLQDNDHAREAYVHHFYGADPNDLRHYHMAIDTTEIELDRCVELIVAAAGRD